ncbi:AAA family ATPase [Marinobacter sp.]|uniref:AAA family ATPase n=1 Tax=Marinobacter sp. TaxID=50741 RepID=UPI003A8F3156
MSENRLSNLIKDLSKAKQQALLIEVLQSDLESLSGQNDDAFKTVCNASAKVFDVAVKSGKTNVLMVGEAQGQARLSLFGALLNSLDEEFDDLHKREILQKLTGFGLSQALGGGVGDAVSESLGVGAEKMMDYLAEWTGSASDFIASAFEKGVEMAAEQSGDLLETAGETGAEAVTGYFSSDNEMYLSRPARKHLKELAPRLSEQATSHETLQLALEMLLVSAQGAPKVIVVKDPLQLDDASLALLAMLVSVEKDFRQLNRDGETDQGRAKTTGVSVVLTFTGSQPRDTVEDNVTEKKLRAISRLRMMASRYNLLERLDSDIPVPAIRASTFVGRETELSILWHDWNRMCKGPDGADVQTWVLIKGEPGTGKTALANRFTQQLRADTSNPARLSIPILRMLNQTGHSAQATGLASLKNSIVDELRRLNLIYEEKVGWFARAGRGFKEAADTLANDARSVDPEAKKRTRRRIAGVISKLVGVDSAIGIASSAKAWREHDGMRNLRQEDFSQSFQANHKEEQYELLRTALNDVRQLALKCNPVTGGQSADDPFPLILIIDDLQWIDEVTAEFLINEWPTDLPVYVIATARGSDSFTTVMDSRNLGAMDRQRNQLFIELGLVEAAPFSSDLRSGVETKQNKGKAKEKPKTSLFLASHLDLKGMDRQMLANLIKMTYAGITKEQADQFAAVVTNNLAGDNKGANVITLFAIEALNVISDPQFYRRNPELPRMIKPLGTDRFCFKPPESGIVGLAKALNKIFEKLTGIYQASYLSESEQSSSAARFNLASYAVLEERLHLIEQYFGEFGGTARYSLLFSALFGAPFNSVLVRYILNYIEQLNSDHHPELAPFLLMFQENAQVSGAPEQFELLERAYEIIRRLRESVENAHEYVYQHDLLRQFLLSQLTRSLLTSYPSVESLKKGVGELVTKIESAFDHWFEKSSEQSGEQRYRLKVAVRGYWYRLMSSYTEELGAWGGLYGESLLNLASCLRNKLDLAESLLLAEEANSIFSSLYNEEPKNWVRGYAVSNFELAATLNALGLRAEALPLYRETMVIIRACNEEEPQRWAESYVASLNNLALAMYEPDAVFDAQTRDQLGREWEAVSLLEEALSICRSGYETSSVMWGEPYVKNLLSLAGMLNKLDSFYEEGLALQGAIRDTLTDGELYIEDAPDSEALPLYNEAMLVSRLGYERSPEHWAERYVESMHWVAVKLLSRGRSNDAWPIFKEALLISRSGFEESPARWSRAYSKSLQIVASSLINADREQEALSLLKDSVSVCQSRYNAAPASWAGDYVASLQKYADKLISADRESEALTFLEDAVSVCRSCYEATPVRWAGDYVAGLRKFADKLISVDRQSQALPLLKEAVSVCRSVYDSAPVRWAKDYIASIELLARTLEDLDRSSEVVPFFRDALSTMHLSYREAPERLIESHVSSLKQQAGMLVKLNYSSEALIFFEEALSALRLNYETYSERLKETHLAILEQYAETLFQLDRVSETVPILEEILSIRRAVYRSASRVSLRDYSDNLLSLASVLNHLGRESQALPLLDEALSVERQRFKAKPERWAQEYVDFLIVFADMQKTFGRDLTALTILEEALPIIRSGSEMKPEQWAEAYSRCMEALILESDALGHRSMALSYCEELLTIHRQDYEFVSLPAPNAALLILSLACEADPDRWSKAYAECLTLSAEEAD